MKERDFFILGYVSMMLVMYMGGKQSSMFWFGIMCLLTGAIVYVIKNSKK